MKCRTKSGKTSLLRGPPVDHLRRGATVFVGEQQVYLVLGKTPLGKPVIIPEPALDGWMKQLTQDWKISPDDLPDVTDQLNRGQSAEVINQDGIPLRLWVNPKARSRGVEPLVKENIPPGTKRDYRKIAAAQVEQQFGEALDPDESDEVARSVVKQWQHYDATPASSPTLTSSLRSSSTNTATELAMS